MLAGAFPFFGNEAQLTKAIIVGKYTFDKPVWAQISEEAKDLVGQLLVVDRSSRLTAEEALQHPFISRYEPQLSMPHSHQQVVKAFRKFADSSLFQRATREMATHSLAPEDRSRIEEEFLELDTDHSGTLTLEELREVMVVEQGMPESQFRDTFAAMDFHNDGEITYADFLAAACFELIPVDQTQLKETFDRFDADHSGYISAENLQEILGPKLGGIDVRHFIGEADTDGDHQIDFDEFVVLMTAAPHMGTVSGKLDVYMSEGSDGSYQSGCSDSDEDGGGRCQSCIVQ
jgi:calcium-dependent protein kinase